MKKVLFILLSCFALTNSVYALSDYEKCAMAYGCTPISDSQATCKYIDLDNQVKTITCNMLADDDIKELNNKTGAKLEDNSGYKETCARTAANNYGVNKKWDMSSKSRQQYASKTPCVDSKDKVYDFSDILTESEEAKIKELLNTYSKKYNMDVIFVSYNLPYTEDKTNEDWLADFYDFNDFGLDYEKYDGIAILRNTYDKDPYFQILSFGEAQMYLYDTRFDGLVNGVRDYFKTQDYVDAVKYIMNYYDNCYKQGPLEGYYVNDMGYIKRNWYKPLINFFIIVFVFSIFGGA